VLVAGLLEFSDAPTAVLREIRRVVAPAASVVLVVPRRRLSFFNPLPGKHYSRARLDRLLVEAMFEPASWRVFGGVYLVRVHPRGGAATVVTGRGVPAFRPVTA